MLGSVHTELLAIADIAKNGYSTFFPLSSTLSQRIQCQRALGVLEFGVVLVDFRQMEEKHCVVLV